MKVSEWISRAISGPGGMEEFEWREMASWHDTDRVAAATWVIRCLANPHNEGSQDVLESIIEARDEVLERDKQALVNWNDLSTKVGK